MSEKKKKNKKIWPYILIFAIGFIIMIYPAISNIYYNMSAYNEIREFEENSSKISDEEVSQRIDLAHAYNDTLDPSRISDPFTKKEKEGIEQYAHMLEVKEKIGYVEIPKIDINLPIYAGTNDEVLEMGAGHLEGSSLPVGGESTHTVITAHRGLPKAKMFRDLDKLEKKDIFYIHNIQTSLAYEVDQIKVVEPTDFDPIMIKEGKDYATLLTCTPYMINSNRLLVRGHRIDYSPPSDEIDKGPFSNGLSYKDLLMFLIPLMLVLFALMIYNRKLMKKAEKRYMDYEKKSKEE